MVSVQDRSVAVREPPPPPRRSRRRAAWWWVPGAITFVTIAAVIVVTLSQLHPSLLFTNTTTTGGDTGAHIAMPWYLRSLISHGHVTGWDPGWYDGFPLYTFYFTLPDFFVAVGSWVIPYDVAFKLGTIAGSVMLPVAAWACGRFFRLRPPIPTLLAAATLPFLFDYTFTIYGGNLFSTLAGEYAFSFSLALSVLFLGLFAAAVREGRHRVWAALVLAACILSHIVPGLYALGGAVVLTVIELLPARWGIADTALRLWRSDRAHEQVPRTRTLWRAGSTVGIGLLLSAFWLVPFGLERAYATSMGYTNLTTYLNQLFPEADTWALVIAGVGVLMAIAVRSRFGLTVTALGAAFALAEVFDPQGSLYNVRLLPMWFISVYLMAGWTFGVGCILVARAWRRARQQRWERFEASFGDPSWVAAPGVSGEGDGQGGGDGDDGAGFGVGPGSGPAERVPFATYVPPPPRVPRWGPAVVSGAVVGLIAVLLVVVPPFVSSSSRGPVHLGPNEVTNWSSVRLHRGTRVRARTRSTAVSSRPWRPMGKRYGCGCAMWEYSANENSASAPPRPSCSCPTGPAAASTPWGGAARSSPPPPRRTTSSTRPELSTSALRARGRACRLRARRTWPSGSGTSSSSGSSTSWPRPPRSSSRPMADPVPAAGRPPVRPLGLQRQRRSDPHHLGSPSTWSTTPALVTPLPNEPAVPSGVDPAPSGWLGSSTNEGPALAWYDPPRSAGTSSSPRSGPADVAPDHGCATLRPPVKHGGGHDPRDVPSPRPTRRSASMCPEVGTPVLVKVLLLPQLARQRR